MQDAQSDQLNQWFASDQPELRKIAAALKRADLSATLNVTALVNEAYLKLRASNSSEPQSGTEFRQRAARVMRNVLADAARSRAALKRGGGPGTQFVAWDENLSPLTNDDRQLLGLDAALTELAALDQRQADMIEWHFFGGLTWAEIATSMGLSLTTVEREWRLLRAWLAGKISNS